MLLQTKGPFENKELQDFLSQRTANRIVQLYRREDGADSRPTHLGWVYKQGYSYALYVLGGEDLVSDHRVEQVSLNTAAERVLDLGTDFLVYED